MVTLRVGLMRPSLRCGHALKRAQQMWRRFGGLPQSGDTGLLLAGPRASPNNMTSILRSNMMKTLGIRQAKAHLSQLVRDAAEGECSLVTDNGRLVAMIGPPPEDPIDREDSSPAPSKRPRPCPAPPLFARRSSAA